MEPECVFFFLFKSVLHCGTPKQPFVKRLDGKIKKKSLVLLLPPKSCTVSVRIYKITSNFLQVFYSEVLLGCMTSVSLHTLAALIHCVRLLAVRHVRAAEMITGVCFQIKPCGLGSDLVLIGRCWCFCHR